MQAWKNSLCIRVCMEIWDISHWSWKRYCILFFKYWPCWLSGSLHRKQQKVTAQDLIFISKKGSYERNFNREVAAEYKKATLSTDDKVLGKCGGLGTLIRVTRLSVNASLIFLAEASRAPAPIDRLKAKDGMKLTTQTLTSGALTLA